MARRILIFSIVMGADNSSKLNFMPTWVLAFYAHNNFCLSRAAINYFSLDLQVVPIVRICMLKDVKAQPECTVSIFCPMTQLSLDSQTEPQVGLILALPSISSRSVLFIALLFIIQLLLEPSLQIRLQLGRGTLQIHLLWRDSLKLWRNLSRIFEAPNQA